MATARQVTVNSTPVLIATCDGTPRSISVHTVNTTYFGGDSSVSSSNGFRLDIDDKFTWTIIDGSSIYAVSGSGSHTVYVWEQIL